MNSRNREPTKPERGVAGEQRWKQLSLSGRRIERSEGPGRSYKGSVYQRLWGKWAAVVVRGVGSDEWWWF